MRQARQRTKLLGPVLIGLVGLLGAAPTPTYWEVQQRIDQARQQLPGDGQPEKTENWNTFFNAMIEEIKNQAQADSPEARIESLERLGRMRDALAEKNWGPSNRVRAALAEWLEPRLAVNRSLEQLDAAVEQLPGSDGEGESSTPKAQWATYVDRINQALSDYESAASFSDRINAARKLRGGFDSLRGVVARRPWQPATELYQALDHLLDQPNVSAVAGVNILQPFLNQDPVKPEVIYFKGQVSYVTPGPRTGFGLMSSDRGIAFYNSQYSYSVTPIQGFQQQVASNPQGQQAANLYQFAATSYNTNHVMAVAVLTPNGLVVDPRNTPAVTAAFGAMPQPGFGPHLGRSLASMIGYDRQRILSELQQQAMPQIRAETAQGTRELSQIKAAQEQARQNNLLRQYLIGNRTLKLQDFGITELNLASNPSAAHVGGVLQWLGAGSQVGADFTQPPEFEQPEPGLTLDVHLGSALTNLAAGYFQSEQIKTIDNLLLKIVPPEGEAPLGEGIEISRNASYQEFLQAIQDVRSQSDDPNAVAMRISKPAEPPIFGVDADGHLVAFIRDVTIEVPAPENFNQRGLFGFGFDPKALRYSIAELEIVMAPKFTTENGGRAVDVEGQIETVTYGGNETTVVVVGDQEDQTGSLNLLNRSAALGILAGKLRDQTVNTSIPTDQLQGFLVRSISDINPTGWIRIVLDRDPNEAVPQPGTATAGAPTAPVVPARTSRAAMATR